MLQKSQKLESKIKQGTKFNSPQLTLEVFPITKSQQDTKEMGKKSNCCIFYSCIVVYV